MPDPETRTCPACSRWKCGRCGHIKKLADPGHAPRPCTKCGSTTGMFTLSKHGRKVWEDHNPGKSWGHGR